VTDATSLAGTHRRTAERFAQFRRRLFEVVPVDVIEREVDRQLPKLSPIPGAEIRRVTPTQPAGWRELLPKSHWRAVEGFLARGDHGYLATIDGTYAMLVEVPYRRLGVAAAVVAAMLSDLREERTAKRVYGWVDSRNRESQALLRIVFGFTQVQTVKRLHLPRLGWQVPGSDKPRFGPVSRVGHHSEAIRP
jgi:GNAT superfamily N-acetyltransferase